MRLNTLLILAIFFSTISYSQVIKPEEAPGLVGKTITVCGKIFDGRFLDNSKTSPTLLNMGATFPKQPITIVIPLAIRKQFGYKPEEVLLNKHICVTGKITKYQKSVQIVIDDRKQLRIL